MFTFRSKMNTFPNYLTNNSFELKNYLLLCNLFIIRVDIKCLRTYGDNQPRPILKLNKCNGIDQSE